MKKIVIFTNNERSINIIKKLKQKYKINLVVLSKKYLSKKLTLKIKKLIKKTVYLENSKMSLLKKISNEKPDFILCCGFPKKISKEIINLPKYCTINLHGGKIPSYLGGSPLNWQIINGENKIYISSLKMNEKIDGGPLIIQKSFKLNKFDNIDVIKSRANYMFPKLCTDSINHVLKGKKLTYFSNNKKKFWRQRSNKDSKININYHSKLSAHNIIRASSIKNYPAFIVVERKKIYLFESKLLDKNMKMEQSLILKKNKLYLKFFDGILLINKFKVTNR